MTKKLSIAAVGEFAKSHGLQQVVVIGLLDGAQHCITYGVTRKDCMDASIAGVFWNKLLKLDDKEKQRQIQKILDEG